MKYIAIPWDFIAKKVLKAKIFTLGEWYSCRGLAFVANSGISTLRLN